MALLCLNFWAGAQAQERLIIGDKVPNVIFSTVLNYKDSTIQLSQFRGKAVILDFWATWCTACLVGFPKLDSLQRLHNKNLQILMLNASVRDTQPVLAEFLQKRKALATSFSLPLIKNDDSIRKVFPIKSMPHYIWIGADGRIKAITRADQITEANIKRLIAGLSLNLKLKTH